MRDRKVPARLTTLEQALKVAWRILKDWVEAQVAMIQSGMVQADEVFLPYRVMSTGQPVSEHYNAPQLEKSHDHTKRIGRQRPSRPAPVGRGGRGDCML